MQVAKYWRNNNLRYRMEGLIQNKVERKPITEPVKLSEATKQSEQRVTSKADVA